MTIEPRAPAVFDDPSFGDPSFPLAVQAGSYKYKLINVESRSNGNIVLNILCNVDRDDSSSDEPSPIDNAYYTIQSEDGTKWATYYIYDWVTNEMSHDTSIYKVYSGGGKLSSSNTSDVFPEGSICWCIWCKEYYDSLIAKIGGGNTVKVSQLEWDTNLVIPDGKAIESATGDVNITGNLLVSGKKLVIGESVGNASVTLVNPTSIRRNYTSPDFAITDLTEGVIYSVPALTYRISSNYYVTSYFTLQAKVGDSYQNIASCSVYVRESAGSASTQAALTPYGATALRYVISSNADLSTARVENPSLSLTPLPVY